jgi:hypothetical protein
VLSNKLIATSYRQVRKDNAVESLVCISKRIALHFCTLDRDIARDIPQWTGRYLSIAITRTYSSKQWESRKICAHNLDFDIELRTCFIMSEAVTTGILSVAFNLPFVTGEA